MVVVQGGAAWSLLWKVAVSAPVLQGGWVWREGGRRVEGRAKKAGEGWRRRRRKRKRGEHRS